MCSLYAVLISDSLKLTSNLHRKHLINRWPDHPASILCNVFEHLSLNEPSCLKHLQNFACLYLCLISSPYYIHREWSVHLIYNSVHCKFSCQLPAGTFLHCCCFLKNFSICFYVLGLQIIYNSYNVETTEESLVFIQKVYLDSSSSRILNFEKIFYKHLHLNKRKKILAQAVGTMFPGPYNLFFLRQVMC